MLDSIEEIDILKEFFLQTEATGIVWVSCDDEAVRMRFFVFAEVVECRYFFGVLCGVDDEDVPPFYCFFYSGNEEYS